MGKKMKIKITTLIICLLLPAEAMAMTGVVEKVDVCRAGNVIFKTSTGWYVNARYVSGVMVKEKDAVSGKLKNFGIRVVTTADGRQGKYYILNFVKNRVDAINAFCGAGISW